MDNNQIGVFKKYQHYPDPQKRELAYACATGIGIQKVDGLSVSPFFIEVAIKNIEGEITINEAKVMIEKHYKKNRSHKCHLIQPYST